ncbi:hypothetical protein ASG29_05715 [Sphingomonas sp. Leaf412]|uniref:FxDxF family PEP-CTERM protein n=1 Tax=Sphingomonas sp. Leaf412 TaxID=1736370 RepID=UPI000700AB30|nr:FxDxF family PEP-CTERM protein [Sphingomonas sp. Leaf412]KQT33536.1 hypothetical protein ASG29_05715 [Sphingomonas sp. Leaf412]
MKALAFAFAGAALAVAAPASAATYITFDGNSGTYGNDLITTPSFTDTFDFTLDTAGRFGATLSSVAVSAATNVNFSRVFLTGPGLGAGIDFSPVVSGIVEFRTLASTFLSAGDYRLTVSGTSGNEGSYAGDLSFAAVPEPATWGLMILGFGMVGGAMRRRAVKTAVRFA